MLTPNDLAEAREFLAEHWPDHAPAVLAACDNAKPFNGNLKEFLTHCTACGGNWGGMLLTGIAELWPEVWNAIPDDMGILAFACIMHTLQLCGVDTSE